MQLVATQSSRKRQIYDSARSPVVERYALSMVQQRTIYASLAASTVVFATLLYSHFTSPIPESLEFPPVGIEIADSDKATQRLAGALRFNTVSSSTAENHVLHPGEFDKLHKYFRSSFPLVFKKLKVQEVRALQRVSTKSRELSAGTILLSVTRCITGINAPSLCIVFCTRIACTSSVKLSTSDLLAVLPLHLESHCQLSNKFAALLLF